MNSAIQQVLINQLLRSQLGCGPQAAVLQGAIQAIESLPMKTGALDRALFRSTDHYDRRAVAIAAEAQAAVGPDAWRSIAAGLVLKHNLHQSIKPIQRDTEVGWLRDFVLTRGASFDRGLLSYLAAFHIQRAFGDMAEEKRYKFLHAGLLFVQGALKAFAADSCLPEGKRALSPARGYEAAGDAVIDHLRLLEEAGRARVLNKLPIPPLPPTVHLCYAMGLRALENAETLLDRSLTDRDDEDAPIRLADVKAKKERVKREIKLLSERHVRIAKEDLRRQLDEIFHPPPSGGRRR